MFVALSLAAVALHSHSPLVIALVNPWTQLVNSLGALASFALDSLYRLTNNYGWTMMLLALCVSLLLLPLSLQALKSMQEQQALAPYIKRIQSKYKNDRQKQSEEMMKLYREHGVNMFGGCLPMLAQYPFLAGVWIAINQHSAAFKTASWLWIGSPFSHSYPAILATSLFQPDRILLVLYLVSMYFSFRLTPTVSMDPQQQQMMKMQSLLMPIVFYFIFAKFSSAFILYWISFNVLSMLERVYVMKLPSRIPKPAEDTAATLAGYPRDCPQCKQLLTVVKGSKCENCGAKVRKLRPSDNGARKLTGAVAVADEAGGKTDGKSTKGSS